MSEPFDFADLAAPGVRALQPYQPGKPLEELEREYGITDAVKLASNENPLGPSPRAVEAALRAAAGCARYPDGNGFALRRALADHHGLAPERITLGNGSNDVLELIARAFLTQEKEALFSEHAFAVYPLVTRAIGARERVVPARDFGHDLEAMAAAVGARTRVVFVANPNNPTGTAVDGASLRRFLEALPEHVIAVVDEAYLEYASDLWQGEDDFPDASQWLDELPNLVVTRTFSKLHALAGLRVGYALSHPQVADLLGRVRQPFNTNSVAQAAAIEALRDQAHQQRSIEANRAGMRQLEAALDRLGLARIPSHGNFIAFHCGEASSAASYEALLRQGVIVRPVDGYGLPGYLRVTVGSEVENSRFISAMKSVIEKRGES